MNQSVTKQQFGYIRDGLVDATRKRLWTSKELWVKTRDYGFAADSLFEATVNALKFSKSASHATSFASYHLSEGKTNAFIIEELSKLGHEKGFAERMVAKAKSECFPPKEVVSERLRPKEALIPALVPVRGIVAELPHYYVRSEEALLAAVTDLLQRRSKPVQASDLVRCLSGAGELVSSKSVFGCLMELCHRGKANRFQVTGTNFFKFEMVGRKQGVFSQEHQRLMTLAEMAAMTGLGREVLRLRLKKMTADQAMAESLNETRSSSAKKRFCLPVCLTPCLTTDKVSSKIEPKNVSALLSYSKQDIDDIEADAAFGSSQPQKILLEEPSVLPVGAAPQHPAPIGTAVTNSHYDNSKNSDSFLVGLQKSPNKEPQSTESTETSIGGGGGFWDGPRVPAAADAAAVREATERALARMAS